MLKPKFEKPLDISLFDLTAPRSDMGVNRQISVDIGTTTLPLVVKYTDIINSGKSNTDKFISLLLHDIMDSIEKKDTIFPNNFLNMKTKKDVRDYPAIYISGGAAYNIYDIFLLKDKAKLFEYSPRTTDYDITFCCNNIDLGDSVNLLAKFFINKLQEYYSVLNTNDYMDQFAALDTSMEEIKKQLGMKEHENIVAVIEDKIILSLYRDPSFKFNYTFKVGLMIKEGEETHYDHLFEFIFTTAPDVYDSIICIKNIEIGTNHFLVPDIISLIKLSLLAIINRGHRLNLYKKCKKDFYRLNYMFKILLPLTSIQLNNILPISYKDMGAYNIKNCYSLFQYIINLLPYCSKDIRETIVVEHLTNLQNYSSSNFDKNYGNEKFINLILNSLRNMLKNLDKPWMIEFEKNKIATYLAELKKKLAETGSSDINFQNKYLKYKTKYLKLKTKLI